MTKYTPEVIEQLKINLTKAAGGEEKLIAALEERLGPPWPDEYVNRDTGKVYTPHNEAEREFVYSDNIRHWFCRGGEGCLSASTRINGIPVPDWQPSPIQTAFGPSPSTGSYLKGQADLYRVRTEHGEDAEVTAGHRFLTPAGWRPLRDLSSGDLIAACDTRSESQYSEINRGFPGRGSADSRLDDELPTPQEVLVRDKLQQLFWTDTYFLDTLTHDRLCRKYSSFLAERTRLLTEFLHHASLNVSESSRMEYRDSWLSRHMSHRPDSAAPDHPLEGCTLGDSPYGAILSQTFSRVSALRILDEYLAWLQLYAYPDIFPIGVEHYLGHTFADGYPSQYQAPSFELCHQPMSSKHQESALSLCMNQLRGMSLQQGGGQCLSSPPYYSTNWTEIQVVSFVKEGDFYDLHVPFWNHYSAHGLLHHNSGKSVAGIVKCLNRIKRKCNGIMVSPTMPHFKVSLWKEFRRWCPWDQVVGKHQVRAKEEWEPFAPFTLVFRNGATLECRGIDNPESCEGPNVNFAFFDEARHKPKALALKVLDGRVRIPGPGGIPPQLWLTSTPRKHWMFEYYGPLKVQCHDCGADEPISIQENEPLLCKKCRSANIVAVDEHEAFKRDSRVITLLTKENEGNVQDNFASIRSQTLTEAEARVLLDAEWEDIEEGQPFLPHISWWDDCEEEIPPLGETEPVVLSIDAATGRVSGESDCFAIIALSRHPTRENAIAVRYIKTWQVPSGTKLDYLGTEHNPGPERELLRLCGWEIRDEKYVRLPKKLYNVKCVVYDPNELHDLGMRFSRKRIAWMEQFGQLNQRIKSDTDLLTMIRERRVAHDGDTTLREHMYNADRKLVDGKKLRIVKRSDTRKIDAAVALSMGAFQTNYLQLGKR